jgi:hypothetical protein
MVQMPWSNSKEGLPVALGTREDNVVPLHTLSSSYILCLWDKMLVSLDIWKHCGPC